MILPSLIGASMDARLYEMRQIEILRPPALYMRPAHARLQVRWSLCISRRPTHAVRELLDGRQCRGALQVCLSCAEEWRRHEGPHLAHGRRWRCQDLISAIDNTWDSADSSKKAFAHQSTLHQVLVQCGVRHWGKPQQGQPSSVSSAEGPRPQIAWKGGLVAADPMRLHSISSSRQVGFMGAGRHTFLPNLGSGALLQQASSGCRAPLL